MKTSLSVSEYRHFKDCNVFFYWCKEGSAREATSVHFSPGKVAWVESYVSASQELKPGNLGIEIK